MFVKLRDGNNTLLWQFIKNTTKLGLLACRPITQVFINKIRFS